MHAYLLAVNLFALTALLVGLNNFFRDSTRWRLLPLFLLAASRAIILIVSLAAGGGPALANALEIFSAVWLVWALMPNPARLQPEFLELGSLTGVLLAVLPLFPGWPVPPPIHSLMVVAIGAPMIWSSLPQFGRLPLLGPAALALANLLALLGYTTLYWAVMLLAYALLVVVLYRDGLQLHRSRQAELVAAARQTINLSRERQRLLDVSRIISAIPGLPGAMAHLARSLAHITGADQAAVFVVDEANPRHLYLAAIYNPERPISLTGRYAASFSVDDYSLLQTALREQTDLLLDPALDYATLGELAALWFEDRLGPTYVQPLYVQGHPVGLLLLANPVSQADIAGNNVALCRHLEPQLAALVESFRHYRAAETPETPPASPPSPPPPTEPAEVTPPVTASPVDGLLNTGFILEAVREGVVASDETGRVRLVNRAAERILGKSRRELMGQPISAVYGQIDSTESIENLAVAFSRRNEPLPTFVELDDKAIQGQILPWRNDDKDWLGIIAIFKDVTPNIKADQARNNFITALSRELRAPLTTIKGYSELILRGAMESYTPEQLHIQQIVHSSVDRMVAVLDNAIQLNAQNKNKIQPHFEQVDVLAVIDEVLATITPLAQLHELTLTKEIKSTLPHITADRRHLYRILENLLENACLYTLPGGYVAVRAWVQHERAGGVLQPELVLMVVDNGIGIAGAEQKRIFEPFYQISGVLESSGLGMGLTVVKELVEMHKGRVWVESVVNEGSIFQVALPLAQD